MITEKLTWSDYQFYSERPSLIDPLAKVREEAGFGCPYCHVVVRRPVTIQQGESYTHDCGLKITVHGNAATCELKGK